MRWNRTCGMIVQCCSCRRVFVRNRPPLAGFTSPAAICGVVKHALRRAGVESARKGAHLFRHSLATSIRQQGASLDEIGELLRHHSPNTTMIYAKLDFPRIASSGTSLGREVPDENPATSGWRLSRTATQPSFKLTYHEHCLREFTSFVKKKRGLRSGGNQLRFERSSQFANTRCGIFRDSA